MKELEILKTYSDKNLEEKKNWYSGVASDYNKVRPRYPKTLINRVLEITQLTPSANILEIGCGPGNATVSFAELGFSMVCLEPNPDFCQLLEQNCQQYFKIKIVNSSFEEWELETEPFDAIIAANSFHWLTPEIVCPKAASILRKEGYLILLWNMTPEPVYEVYQEFSEAYDKYAPSLKRYEGQKKQAEILENLGANLINYHQFKDLVWEYIPCQITYSTKDYLTLLNTFSPYIQLDYKNKDFLWKALANKIDNNLGGHIELTYLCAFHIVRKVAKVKK